MTADQDLETGIGIKHTKNINTNRSSYGLASSEPSNSWRDAQIDPDSTLAKMHREDNTSRHHFLQYAIPLTILYITLTLAIIYDMEYTHFLQQHGLWEIGQIVILTVGSGLVWLAYLLMPRWQQRARSKLLAWIATGVYLIAVVGIAAGFVKPEDEGEVRGLGIKAGLDWIKDTAMSGCNMTMGFGP